MLLVAQAAGRTRPADEIPDDRSRAEVSRVHPARPSPTAARPGLAARCCRLPRCAGWYVAVRRHRRQAHEPPSGGGAWREGVRDRGARGRGGWPARATPGHGPVYAHARAWTQGPRRDTSSGRQQPGPAIRWQATAGRWRKRAAGRWRGRRQTPAEPQVCARYQRWPPPPQPHACGQQPALAQPTAAPAEAREPDPACRWH
jgi:hypothetical protein